MAGDWIKMRVNLWDDPRVAAICDQTGESETTVVGGLFRLWSIADQHSTGGYLPSITAKSLDRKTGIEGFSAALQKVDWLTISDDGLVIPHFSEHNGTSAKKRAEDAKRKATKRDVRDVSAKCPQDDGQIADTKSRNADEKSRNAELEKEKSKSKRKSKSKEKEPPLTPHGGNLELPENLNTPEFQEAWATWIEYRAEAKIKKYTKTGAGRMIARLSELGPADAVKAIHFSIMQGYQGIFEERKSGKGKSQGGVNVAEHQAFLDRYEDSE